MISDYNEFIPEKTNDIYNIVLKLKKLGVIDGIAMKSHLYDNYPSLDDYKIAFLGDNNITLYIDKGHIYKTMKKSDLNNKMSYDDYSDIVIDNIGFIYSKKGNTLLINKVDNVEIRDSLVGNNE